MGEVMLFNLYWEIVPYQKEAIPVGKIPKYSTFDICGYTVKFMRESLGHAVLSIDGMFDAILKLMRDLSSRSDVIFYDIGANLGVYSFLTVPIRNMRVYAFEPNPVLFDDLCKNVVLNNLTNRITCCSLAVSDYIGKGHLSVLEKPLFSGLSSLGDISWLNRPVIKKKVQTITLDDFVKDHKIPNVIKSDAEGAELAILKGGIKTLSEHHPVLILEFAPKRMKNFGYGPQDILDVLSKLEYNNIRIMETMKTNGQMTGSKDIIAWNS